MQAYVQVYVQTAFTRPTQRRWRCFLFAELCWHGTDGTCAFTFPLYFRLRFLGLHVRNATTRANVKNDVFPIFFFVGNWACVCICVTQCSSHVYFLGFAFVNCIWVTVVHVNQTLNSYHVTSIEDQRVISLAPFFVESAYKKYTKCAMNVYLLKIRAKMRVKLLSMAVTGRVIVLCALAAQLSWESAGLLSGRPKV